MAHNELEHKAIVRAVYPDKVVVVITQSSACSGCHAARACSAADYREHAVEVFYPRDCFEVGEEVKLIGRYSMGSLAVLITFLIPLVLLLLVAISSVYLLGMPELYAALTTLASVLVYFLVLSFFRRSLSKKFVFYLEKIQTN